MNTFATLEMKESFSQEVISFNKDSRVLPIELEEATAVGCMKQLVELTGLPMMAVDVLTGVIFAKSDDNMVTVLPGEVLQQLSDVTDCKMISLESGLVYLAVPLPAIDRCETVAIGSVYAGQGNDNQSLMQQTAMTGLSAEERLLWASQQQTMLPTLMQNLLNLALQNKQQSEEEVTLRSQLHQRQNEIDQTAAGIRFLHRLADHSDIRRDPQVLVDFCLEQLASLISTEGQIVLLDDGNGSYQIHSSGRVPLNEQQVLNLVTHCDGHDWLPIC